MQQFFEYTEKYIVVGRLKKDRIQSTTYSVMSKLFPFPSIPRCGFKAAQNKKMGIEVF